MENEFIVEDAHRQSLKVKIGLTGATNTGKTWSALLLAGGLLLSEGKTDPKNKTKPDWDKVVLIDTERNRSLAYAELGDIGKFKYISFKPPYSPDRLLLALASAKRSGAEVIIIDSFTHIWNGEGGLLEIVNEKTEKSKSGNSFTAWNGKTGGTAVQNNMVNKLLDTDTHVIVTFRQKMDYKMEVDAVTGKTKVVKHGTKPIQRDDLEYEFDITLKFNNLHQGEIIKNIMPVLGDNGDIIEPVTIELGKEIGDYFANGISQEEILESKRLAGIEQIKNLGNKNPSLITLYKTIYKDKKISELTLKQTKNVLEKFNQVLFER
ncbi:MAG: AAA family ATPase [Bacilli bacterium]